MSKRDDGGPAFPVQDDEKLHPSYGMTMRDYIAIKAMAADIANAGCNSIHEDGLAKWSYEMADAMLKERSK